MAVWHTALQPTKCVGIIHILRSNTNSPWKWSPFNQVDPVCLKVPLPQTFAGPGNWKRSIPTKAPSKNFTVKASSFFGKQQFLLPLPGACPWQETWWLFPRLPWRFPQMDNKTSIGQTFCWKGQACQLSTNVPSFSGAVSWSKSTGSAESPGKAWQRHNAPGNSLKTPAMFGINGKETCVFPATMRSSNNEFSPAGSSSSWMVGRKKHSRVFNEAA